MNAMAESVHNPTARPSAYAAAARATSGMHSRRMRPAPRASAHYRIRHRNDCGRPFGRPHDPAGEGRTCGARELHGEVMAEQCGVPRHEYRAEVPRARHEHRLATARLALHEHLVTRAERAQVPGARTGAHR